jgi:hypothetical protein
MPIDSTTSRRSFMLRAVFALYLISILVFAGIYYRVFRTDPKSFAFNADIRLTQSESVSHIASAEIAQLTKRVPCLIEMQHAMASKESFDSTSDVVTFPKSEFIFSKNYSFQFTDDTRKPHDKARTLTIAAFDIYHELVFECNVPFIPILSEEARIAHYREYAIDFLSDIQRTVQTRESQLATLASPNPDVWTFWDFLYFSTITQSTVGYGDILPNCTLVRMLVTLQLVVSSLLLIVVLNSVVQTSRSE